MTDGWAWQQVVDFMNETCGICGCLLNNWPECEEGCIHTGNLDLCPRFRARERLPGDAPPGIARPVVAGGGAASAAELHPGGLSR